MAAGNTRMAPGMKYAREASQNRHRESEPNVYFGPDADIGIGRL